MLEEVKGYLVKCDKCGCYLGYETDWVVQQDEVLYLSTNNGWEVIGEEHICPKCKNNNKK